MQLIPHEFCSFAETAIKNTLIAGFGTEKDDTRNSFRNPPKHLREN